MAKRKESEYFVYTLEILNAAYKLITNMLFFCFV